MNADTVDRITYYQKRCWPDYEIDQLIDPVLYRGLITTVKYLPRSSKENRRGRLQVGRLIDLMRYGYSITTLECGEFITHRISGHAFDDLDKEAAEIAWRLVDDGMSAGQAYNCAQALARA